MPPNHFYWMMLAAVLSGAAIHLLIGLFFMGRLTQRVADLAQLVERLRNRTDPMPGGCPLHTHHCPLNLHYPVNQEES